MAPIKKPEAASGAPSVPTVAQAAALRKATPRGNVSKPVAAIDPLRVRAKMSAPSKVGVKAQLKMAMENKEQTPAKPVPPQLKMVMAGEEQASAIPAPVQLKAAIASNEQTDTKPAVAHIVKSEPRINELKKVLSSVVRKASPQPPRESGTVLARASTEGRLRERYLGDMAASGGVNKARKSFPVTSVAAATKSGITAHDFARKPGGMNQRKHKKRFFRGTTYGLYLSAPRKKRKHQMPKKPRAESDESGGGGSEETASEDRSSLHGDEASSEHSSLTSSRMAEDAAREFSEIGLEERMYEEENSTDTVVPALSMNQENSFLVVASLDHGGKTQSAKKTIQKVIPEDSTLMDTESADVSKDVCDGMLSLKATVVTGKENSQPMHKIQRPQDIMSAIRIAATAGATDKVQHHGSSIASSVKSRQRIKRRIMEDHVDVDEVSMCSSTSASPDMSSTGLMKKPKKANCNGGLVPATPLSQADTNFNYNSHSIKVEVVFDLRFPTVSKCCCVFKPLDPVSSRLSESRTYCQGLDSVHGRVVGCTHVLADVTLLRPSVRILYSALCEAHKRRLRLHHCCPQCGVFCTQGEFLQCTQGGSQTHLFHKQCQPLSSGPAGEATCPHCASTGPFWTVRLEAKAPRPPIFYLGQKVPTPMPRARMSCVRSAGGSVPSPIALKLPDVPGEQYVVEGTEAVLSADSLPLCPAKKELDLLLRGLRAEKLNTSRHSIKTLFAASKSGDLEKALQAIACGFDVNTKLEEHEGSSALHIASAAGHLAIVHLLIQAGALVDIFDDQLYTPLMRAVDAGSTSVVHYLLKVGADLRARGEDGMTCLHLAARCGNLQVCQIFLDSDTVPINVQDDGGWTPLVWASEHRRVSVVRLLLSRGADPNLRDGEENTALHWSAFSGNVEISWMYLDRGCDVNALNEHGDTPLHIAARQDNYDAVVLLLNHGASLDAVNKRKDTPLACCKDEKSLSFSVLSINQELGHMLRGRKSTMEKILHKDISRGKELNLIQCVNGEDDEPPPSDFLYLVENCETSPILIDRTITSLQSCKCEDGCTSQGCICSNISYRCWYSKEGRLVDEFNMLDPPMLFECNRACLCWSNCYNRVVQNGITCHLQLFRTKGKGWGVRTLQDIPRGTFVCEYIGEILSDSEADKREDDSYLFDLENRDGETYCLDARYYGNISRFVNHLCEPNLVSVRVFVDHQDLSFPRMAFFSSKDIKANEELGFDYGEKFWMIKYKMFTCECGAEKCKYSKDSIQETLINYNRRMREEPAPREGDKPTPQCAV